MLKQFIIYLGEIRLLTPENMRFSEVIRTLILYQYFFKH